MHLKKLQAFGTIWHVECKAFLRKWEEVWGRILYSLKPCKLAAILERSKIYRHDISGDAHWQVFKYWFNFTYIKRHSSITLDNGLLCQSWLKTMVTVIHKHEGEKAQSASVIKARLWFPKFSYLQLTQENQRAPKNIDGNEDFQSIFFYQYQFFSRKLDGETNA